MPFISDLGQYKSDRITSISEGTAIRESTVIFKAKLTDPDSHQVKLQIELRQINEPFTGMDDGGILNSDFVNSGSGATIIRPALIERKYHWRVRAIDSRGIATNWQEFGISGNVDFLIGDWSAFTEVSQKDFSYTTNVVPNVYQSLGNGLSGTATAIELRGFPAYWWTDLVKFSILECRSQLVGFNVQFSNFECSHITETFVVRPDSSGYINQPINITFNPDKYYAIFFYQDWKISGSTNLDNYPNGSIGSFGSVNVGELKQAYFYLVGAKMASPSPILKDPVIIVPGIMGSWWKKVLPGLSASELVLDPIQHTYDDLFNALATNGYTPGQTLFSFPYDWRNDNRITASVLRDKIIEIKSICNCQKVDIITHSMGGLVARYYIESNLYQNDIDQLILLGTPNKGAPKSYLAWEAGVSDSSFDTLVFTILAKAEGFNNSYDYVRNKPLTSVKQLLPVYNYLKNAISGNLLTYPNGYPENLFLGNSDADLGLNSPSGLLKLEESGVRIINIIGDNSVNNTINVIRIINDPSRLPLWEHGYPENYDGIFGDHGLELGGGDGTVPLTSAQSLNLSNVQQVVINSEHSELPTNAFDEVFQILTGNPTNPIQPTSLIKKLLIIPVFSPVDIQIIDPLGRRMGKDFSTNQEFNEIPLAYYTGFGHPELEFVTIPNPLDGEYQIKTQGTGAGEYTINTIFISDTTSTETAFNAKTQTELIEDLKFSFNSNAPETTLIQPMDNIPPTITHSGIQKEYLINFPPVIFTFSAQDDITGVFNISAKLDGQPIASGDLINFTAPGHHTIEIKAEDFVGNVTTTVISFDVIYQFGGFLPPIKTDGTGIYKLGRTLPIKFQLIDVNGQFIANAIAKLTITKIDNGILGGEEIPLSTSAADTDNLFRYDIINNQYIYNLSTDAMSTGRWQLKTRLDDGKIYTVNISIR